MRILISTFSRNVIGGVETYLRNIMPALSARRHEVLLFHEIGSIAGTEDIDQGVNPSICTHEIGSGPALEAARSFAPDVVYQHGLLDPALERGLMGLAPTVLFAHSYYGMCISGTKRFLRPQLETCTREFGPTCLALYLPRGCGGMNPRRMYRDYVLQAKRLDLLPRYTSVLVASNHMARELGRHGVSPRPLTLPLTWSPEPAPPPVGDRPTGRLLVAGRLTQDKGVRLVASAAELAGAQLKCQLTLRFAGIGPEDAWIRARSNTASVRVESLGWLERQALRAEMAQADLLVMPSVWPEPFGLVGVEAAALGVPAVGFDVGGIPEWLVGGRNGELASLRPNPITALADALIRALERPEHWNALRHGAWAMARSFTVDAHVAALEQLLSEACGSRPGAVAS